jgi:hypothetical protein
MSVLEQFLGLKPALFAPNSRYYGLPTATLPAADGRAIVYLRRRFIPPVGGSAAASATTPVGGNSLVLQHGVLKGDRLDNLAAGAYGDPELYWRIADANEAMAPDELTETSGRVLRITASQGQG